MNGNTATATKTETDVDSTNHGMRIVGRKLSTIENECSFLTTTSMKEGMSYEKFSEGGHHATLSPCAREIFRKLNPRKTGEGCNAVLVRFKDLIRETGENHLTPEEVMNARFEKWHDLSPNMVLHYVARCAYEHLKNIREGKEVFFCMKPFMYEGKPSVLVAKKGKLFNEFYIRCVPVFNPLNENSIMLFGRE